LINHERGDVREFKKTNNKSGVSIKNRLDGKSILREANKKRIMPIRR